MPLHSNIKYIIYSNSNAVDGSGDHFIREGQRRLMKPIRRVLAKMTISTIMIPSLIQMTTVSNLINAPLKNKNPVMYRETHARLPHLENFQNIGGGGGRMNELSVDRTGVHEFIHQSPSHYTTVNAAASHRHTGLG